MRRLSYSKHLGSDRCGVALFAGTLARHLGAVHVHDFRGFSACDEFYVNMDILELSESEVQSLCAYIASGKAGVVVLVMHDYRHSYLEDRLIQLADVVVNLSGEPALDTIRPDITLRLFTPSIVDPPMLGLSKSINGPPLSLAFGFFSPRKKSFKSYIAFYEHMAHRHPEWRHIIVASAHVGNDDADRLALARVLSDRSVVFLDFLPGALLAELISVADLGVCIYPDGIMMNNTAPISFFERAKTVVTTYGERTPREYQAFTLDLRDLSMTDFSDLHKIRQRGHAAHAYHDKHLSWAVFVEALLSRVTATRAT